MGKDIFGKHTLINGDCAIEMGSIPDNSIDVICTDPPYLYLKNQKLDIPFDEVKVFSEWMRILKNDGFVIMFGRGESFYRWNTMLANLGFKFKEEIVWDKGYCSSPLMSISRIHETISIWTKGNGVIRKSKIPYLEMKNTDIPSVIQDIKRLSGVLNNPRSLNAVKSFLEDNIVLSDGRRKNVGTTISSPIEDKCRCSSVMSAINNGMQEKTIIRADREQSDRITAHAATVRCNVETGDRCTNVMQSIEFWMNEKTIIEETAQHYSTIHPTQKPVRLIERLLSLSVAPFSSNITVLDSFSGSMSTGIASYNLGLESIMIELDKEYFKSGKERIWNHQRQQKLF